MYPKPLTYRRARTLDEAFSFLSENEDARVIAGGQSIMPMLKLRIASPSLLVDIAPIRELHEIRMEGNEIIIGAMVTHREIIESREIKSNIPMLQETARHIADVQIRNRGTLGGSICEADPSADYTPTLLVLDARVTLKSAKGERTVSLDDFLVGPFEVDIKQGEILTSVIIPVNRSAYSVVKYARRAADFAVASMAALVEKKTDGTVSDIRVAVGAQSDRPLRLRDLESELTGIKPQKRDLHLAVEKAVEGLEPIDDIHGSADYRKEVTSNILKANLGSLIFGGDSK
ncbi:MAG: xanthine dehydrogenase family protein subunit M [Candidatus Thermoplasmatota archaeon]|jgi:CO/xanthine dehydrogenase FAD-binding subunit|nr:xanthine dehydrogenase family protein subunit M [Candidatus Thermoplasmatota archaeon]